MHKIYFVHKLRAYSLLELVLAMLMASILAMIAVPSYQDSIRSGRRGAAKAELLRLSQEQAKWRSAHLSYADFNELGPALADVDYTYEMSNLSASTFSIRAVPTTTRNQNLDVCGTLQIDQSLNLRSNQSTCPQP